MRCFCIETVGDKLGDTRDLISAFSNTTCMHGMGIV